MNCCVKFAIADAAIILKRKKDFIDFGFVGLKQKLRGKTNIMSGNKQKNESLINH